MTARGIELRPLCARCGDRIAGATEPNPQRDLFAAATVVHAGRCPAREPHLELLARRDTDEGVRFLRWRVEGRRPRATRPRLSRHPLGGGL